MKMEFHIYVVHTYINIFRRYKKFMSVVRGIIYRFYYNFFINLCGKRSPYPSKNFFNLDKISLFPT